MESKKIGPYVIVDDLHMDIYEIDRFLRTKSNQGLKEKGLKKKMLKILNNTSQPLRTHYQRDPAQIQC